MIVGLARLGIELHSGRGGSEYVRYPGCFSSATSADLLWQGRKLIGSALVRRGGTVLQHGSIQIQPDRIGLATLFPEQVPTAIVGLTEIQPDLDGLQVAEVLAAACAQVFACPVIASEWSDWERRFIRGARARWAIG